MIQPFPAPLSAGVDQSFAPDPFLAGDAGGGFGASLAPSAGRATADSFGSVLPIAEPIVAGPAAGFGAAAGGTSLLGSLEGLLRALIGLLQSAFGSGANLGSSPYASMGPDNQQYYIDATGSSVGDPHDAFGGTMASGANVSDRWDSMAPHRALLTSDSIPGGFRVATQTTSPAANGATCNRRAAVITNGGATRVWLDADGRYGAESNGQPVSLTPGAPADLGNGETVTLGTDGSLDVVATAPGGGSISTRLSRDGNGVDVSATAQNVDLGGYLAQTGALGTG